MPINGTVGRNPYVAQPIAQPQYLRVRTPDGRVVLVPAQEANRLRSPAAPQTNASKWTTSDEARSRLEMVQRFGRNPIPVAGLKNVVEMNEDLWHPKDLIRYFEENKKPGQEGIIVVAKTELCASNEHIPCKVTTTVLENTQAINDKFMVFMAWIKHPASFPADRRLQAQKAAFDQAIERTYDFEQGPGAKIVFINPKNGQMLGTDAAREQLLGGPFRANRGLTPRFEQTLDGVVQRFGFESA